MVANILSKGQGCTSRHSGQNISISPHVFLSTNPIRRSQRPYQNHVRYSELAMRVAYRFLQWLDFVTPRVTIDYEVICILLCVIFGVPAVLLVLVYAAGGSL